MADVVEEKVVKTTVPVTKMVEVVKEVPVTREEKFVENVEILEKVPVTTYQEVTKEVPIKKTKQLVENVQVITTEPVTQTVEVIRNVPVLTTKTVTENIEVKTQVPITEQVEVTKTVPVTRYVNVVENYPTTSTVTKTEETVMGAQPISREILYTREGIEDLKINQEGHVINSQGYESMIKSQVLYGVPGCTHCGGTGQINKTKSKGKKACTDCVKTTGNCIVCQNTGFKNGDASKNCNCQYGGKTKTKNLKIVT